MIQLLNVVKATNDNDLYLVFEFMDSDLHVVIKNRLLLTIHHQYIMYQVTHTLSISLSINQSINQSID